MARRRFDILGVGVAAVDDFLYVRRFPQEEQKVPVLGTGRKLGGLVATALAAAARVGSACAYYGRWGPDELSAAVRLGFEREGIDASRVQVAEGAGVTHSVIVAAEEGHTRTIFFDLKMEPLPLDPALLELLQSSQVLLTDQLGQEAAGAARRLGVPVVVDLDWPDHPEIRQMMALADHLIVSRNVARAVTGCADPRRAARELHGGSGRACTAVTCGGEGCCFIHGPRGELQSREAPPVTAVETTGCGDVFHGAYASRLALGRSVPECIAYASAAAAIYASRPSGWEYLPAHSEVESLRRQAARRPAARRQPGS